MSVVTRYLIFRVSVISWDGRERCIGLTAYWSIGKHPDKLSWWYIYGSTLVSWASIVFEEEHVGFCGFLHFTHWRVNDECMRKAADQRCRVL